MEIVERAVFRVTRDADFEVSDEADDLLEAVQLELRRRRFGDVVRVEVSALDLDARCSSGCKRGLGVADDQIYLVDGAARPRRARSSWPRSTGPSSRTSRGVPVDAAAASRPRRTDVLFAEIRAADILVHHPYDSFATSFEAFVRAAARRPAT